jgi:adenosine deaminase
MMKPDFLKALKNNDLRAVRKIPKSDLHNHCLLGGNLRLMEKFYGQKIERFRGNRRGIQSVNEWLGKTYRPVFDKPDAFGKAVEAAFLQAKNDGVTVLEMSMDVMITKLLNIPLEDVISTLQHYHKEVSPEIVFRPDIGLARNQPANLLMEALGPFAESGYFRSIDLYDDESAQPVQNFVEIYRYARKKGLKCKAHAGEFRDADFIRQSVELLELDEVQHGISAAASEEVMKWLVKHAIQLNVSPASNIALKRAKSYKTHPIRILYDNGVKVTVNTDDVILFGKGNSEQYLQLYKCGLFKAGELDEIRKNGLG